MIVKIKDNQYGFKKGKSTTEPMFYIRLLLQKYREYDRKLHVVFIDLEKAYDTIPRDLIWYFLRRKNVSEAFIDIIKDMCQDSITLVSTTVGETEEIETKIDIHQGSALSRLLFIIIMDVMTDDIEEETPWAMLFADDISQS